MLIGILGENWGIFLYFAEPENMGFVEIELIVEVCGIRDFLGDGNEGKKPPVDKGVAILIFEGLFETGTPGPARLGRNKRIRLKIRKK